MYQYRVTKYNPQFRETNGSYNRDEWTSFSDIGKVFRNKCLSLEDYIEVENKYINSLFKIAAYYDVKGFKIKHLEKNEMNLNELSNEFVRFLNELREGKEISVDEIYKLCQLIMRDFVWAELQSKNMVVTFGEDYYMYFNLSGKLSSDTIIDFEKDGLYIEEHQSPYHEFY